VPAGGGDFTFDFAGSWGVAADVKLSGAVVNTAALQELFARITAQLQSERDEPVRIAARVESEFEEPVLPVPTRKGALPPAR